MNDPRTIRVILLSCAEYADKDAFRRAVTALSAAPITDGGFARLRTARMAYSETEAPADPRALHGFGAIETARMDRYVNSLLPKYRTELRNLLERWNCSEDRDNVEHYIGLNAGIKENIHKKKMERGNDKQNRVLALIALLQLVSLYDSIDKAYTLQSTQSFVFILGTAAIAVCVLGYVLVVVSRD